MIDYFLNCLVGHLFGDLFEQSGVVVGFFCFVSHVGVVVLEVLVAKLVELIFLYEKQRKRMCCDVSPAS